MDWQSRKLVWGVGVSLTNSSDPKLIENINKLQHVVVHVIDGIFTKNDIDNLKDHNISLLVLGYKKVGRGKPYYDEHRDEIEANIEYLKNNLLSYKSNFDGIAFDNHATENLDIKRQVTSDVWNAYYMGEEGSYTFYLDAVSKKFAISSMEETQYDMLDSVDEMFNEVRRLQGFI